jgi:transposase InsO family protein
MAEEVGGRQRRSGSTAGRSSSAGRWTEGPSCAGVALDVSRPEKPTGDADIEPFNGEFRRERLNANGLLSRDDAGKCEARRRDDDDIRPHGSLDGGLPTELRRALQGAKLAKW